MTRFEVLRDLIAADPTAWALGRFRDQFYATNAAVIVFLDTEAAWQALRRAGGSALRRAPVEDVVARMLPADPGLPAVDLALEYHGTVPSERLYLVDAAQLVAIDTRYAPVFTGVSDLRAAPYREGWMLSAFDGPRLVAMVLSLRSVLAVDAVNRAARSLIDG